MFCRSFAAICSLDPFAVAGLNRRFDSDHTGMKSTTATAARLLRRQRGVPLPRAGVRRAALRPGGRARRRVAADRSGRGRLRGLAPAVARLRAHVDGRAAHRARVGRRARRDEHLLLPRDRPAAARDRRRDRVPARDRARGARSADAAQRRSRWLLAVAGVYLLTDVGSRGSRSASRSRSPTRSSSRSTSCSGTASRGARRRAGSTRSARRCSSRWSSSRRSAGWAAVPALDRPGRARGGDRRRHRLVGDPVRLRPARDGAPRPRRPTRCSSRCCPRPRP